ncbi:MAG: sugar ABC transporter ATP-binding protein [Victivallales bacterium]|nr:sugar ABC transporter ATP-binding protein [Victivallales bacterium]
MGDFVLEMRNVSKSFGTVNVLRDVSFQLRKGCVHAICGENGAGKSTLMKILSGLYPADSGEMLLDGQVYAPRHPGDAIASGIAMIYQELDLAPDLTVAENIFLGQEPKKMGFILDDVKLREMTIQLLEKYGFFRNFSSEYYCDCKVRDLGIGDAQLVELLKALNRNARIVVMDEPTSSLSSQEAELLFSIIEKLRENGIAIVYITHRMDEISRLADYVSILRDGEMVCSCKASEIDVPGIIKHMVGREIKDFYPKRNAAIGETVLSVEELDDGKKISGVSFDLRAGEIVGMAGLVGAGRTEVAEAIFGIRHVVAGKVLLDRRELRHRSPASCIHEGIGYLTEDRKRSGLCLGLPSCWNISLPNLEKIGMGTFISLAKELQLATKYGKEVSTRWSEPMEEAENLSGGNQQKLLLARWLMAESKVLILDEPTRGVDVAAKKEIYTILNSLAEAGKAILMISSELPEILGMCDRILVMKDGRMVQELPGQGTTQEEIMKFAAI